MMLLRFSLTALGLAVAAAQEPLPPLPSLPDLPAAEEEQVDAAQEQAYREQIKAAEERLLAGVQKLHELHRVLLGVKDADSAAAAVPAIIRLTGELHDWAAGFSGLPAPSPEDLARLQGDIAPAIRRINARIANQADRLGSAEYYGCTDLAAALAQFVLRLRQ
ncbi:MAG: hypothetical protein ACI4PY_05300 [Akkermansia muciniphila]